METEAETEAVTSAAVTAVKVRDALSQLTVDNKIVINTLTDIAKEHVSDAGTVTRIIDNHLMILKLNGELDKLLPLLETMDSIVRSSGAVYEEKFGKNLCGNFKFVVVHLTRQPELREKLLEMRRAWERDDIFPSHLLDKLDREVKAMDPVWPMSSSDKQPRQMSLTDNGGGGKDFSNQHLFMPFSKSAPNFFFQISSWPGGGGDVPLKRQRWPGGRGGQD